jgi:hypothetical protein
MKRMKRLLAFHQSAKKAMAVIVCLSITITTCQWSLFSSEAKSPIDDEIKKAKVQKLLSNYQAASVQYLNVKQVLSNYADKSFATEAEVKTAIEELQKLDEALAKSFYGHLVQVALTNKTFKASLEGESAKVSAINLQIKLKTNRAKILEINGARQVEADIKKEKEVLRELYTKIGNNLKTASRQNGAKKVSLNRQQDKLSLGRFKMHSLVSTTEASRSFNELDETALTANALTSFDGGVTLAITAAAILLIGAWAAGKAQDFAEPEDGGDTEMKVCTDRAERRRTRCLNRARNNWWLRAECFATYLLNMSNCWAIPQ